MGLSGDIRVVFTVEPGTVHYIGRLHMANVAREASMELRAATP